MRVWSLEETYLGGVRYGTAVSPDEPRALWEKMAISSLPSAPELRPLGVVCWPGESSWHVRLHFASGSPWCMLFPHYSEPLPSVSPSPVPSVPPSVPSVPSARYASYHFLASSVMHPRQRQAQGHSASYASCALSTSRAIRSRLRLRQKLRLYRLPLS